MSKEGSEELSKGESEKACEEVRKKGGSESGSKTSSGCLGRLVCSVVKEKITNTSWIHLYSRWAGRFTGKGGAREYGE